LLRPKEGFGVNKQFSAVPPDPPCAVETKQSPTPGEELWSRNQDSHRNILSNTNSKEGIIPDAFQKPRWIRPTRCLQILKICQAAAAKTTVLLTTMRQRQQRHAESWKACLLYLASCAWVRGPYGSSSGRSRSSHFSWNVSRLCGPTRNINRSIESMQLPHKYSME